MYVHRNLEKRIAPFLESMEAIVVTGMRRVGKTTLLRHISKSIKSENKAFFDLENPIDQQFFEESDYNRIITKLGKMGLSTGERIYLFIDEIQAMKNIPSVVKYLIDHHNVKFFLSGSASYYIRNLFSESLAGRKYIFELFPFSFDEFLRAKKEISPPDKNAGTQNISKWEYQMYDKLLDEYLCYGGFPDVVLAQSELSKKEKLKSIFSSYYQLEVEKMSDFRKKTKVRDLIFLLMERTGSKIDISKLSVQLGVSRNTVMEYLAFLEDTYLIHTISPYSKNRDVEIRGAKKFYFCDTGILNHFANVSEGSLFENLCFSFLRKPENKINYWQKKDGQEIDFIVNEKIAYEAKLFATEQDLRKLRRRSESIGMSDYKIISKKFSDIDSEHLTYAFLL